LVKLAVVGTAKRYSKFVAYFETHCALLGELKMVRIRWAATAGQAGLSAYELQMVPISKSKLFAKGGDELPSSFGWDVLG
jgi:hypothetical protein